MQPSWDSNLESGITTCRSSIKQENVRESCQKRSEESNCSKDEGAFAEPGSFVVITEAVHARFDGEIYSNQTCK